MIYLTAEQAQQIEEAFISVCDAFLNDDSHGLYDDAKEALATIRAARMQEQEPVEKQIAAAVLDHCYGYSAVNDDMIERTSVVVKRVLDKQAAHVRTKDLTDGELTAIWERNAGDWLACFRAVIAADRRKNRG